MEFLILILIALIISSIGYYKYIYFISLGYGFSVVGLGAAMLIMFRNDLKIDTIVMCVLFIVYGFRLGGYLLLREIRSASYRNTMKKEIKDGKDMKFIAKFFIWISCAALYAMQVSPVLFRMKHNKSTDIVAIVGCVIMFLGILLESASDIQKSKSKAKNPNRFCDTGLFKIVRCPNYLGEVLFWTGVFVCGVNTFGSVLEWLSAIVGYLCIVYIMFGGARRLEIRQNRNYGNDPEYQEYVKKTPILIPLIPLYSVEKYKFLVG
ncbi:MAG: DUF1295 domain-containing protein [Lachnospiraceae bacterium]|nr:DUF1295 domain-containing protein [Lachnospiraceae bacterium]